MNQLNTIPSLIIVMGVSGTGKSSLASLLADSFGYRFIEGDDFHDTCAKAQMSQGISLTDEQRQRWIDRIYSFLTQISHDKENIVLAYSGLKKRHREQFRELPFEIDFILLNGDSHLISKRIENRADHFIRSDFLGGQLKEMEWPTSEEPEICYVNVDRDFDVVYMHACLLLSKHDKFDFLSEHL